MNHYFLRFGFNFFKFVGIYFNNYMAATETNMIPLGYVAPDFSLLNVVTLKEESLQTLKGEKGTVVMFICNHCPYVIHVLDQIIALSNDYQNKGIGFIAISSNDIVNYPQDGPDKMAELAKHKQFPFPYLYDETQSVAKAYFAACTPDFSIYDADLKCIYRGQLDGARPKNDIPVTGRDIRQALDFLLDGKGLVEPQIPSIGCNIKWKN